MPPSLGGGRQTGRVRGGGTPLVQALSLGGLWRSASPCPALLKTDTSLYALSLEEAQHPVREVRRVHVLGVDDDRLFVLGELGWVVSHMMWWRCPAMT